MSSNKSAEQNRAKYALGVIDSHKSKDASWQERYSSYVKSLPATILTCGVGQAMASLLAKAGDDLSSPHGQLYRDLEGWLCRNQGIFSSQANLMTALTDAEMDTYLAAQAEALAMMVWLKKFAVAFLKKAKGGGSD
ncbi:MAG: type III-B CRISPR module-associated protein Cmr5 [Bacillota bacterium]|jgi:CRISPR-associated protein Cmr5